MKHTYTISAHNDQGAHTSAGIDFDHPHGGRKYSSIREAENAARGELGSGWHVEIIRDDGEIVSHFTIK